MILKLHSSLIRRFLPFSSSEDEYKFDGNEKYEEYSKINPDNSRKYSISYGFFDGKDSEIAKEGEPESFFIYMRRADSESGDLIKKTILEKNESQKLEKENFKNFAGNPFQNGRACQKKPLDYSFFLLNSSMNSYWDKYMKSSNGPYPVDKPSCSHIMTKTEDPKNVSFLKTEINY